VGRRAQRAEQAGRAWWLALPESTARSAGGDATRSVAM